MYYLALKFNNCKYILKNYINFRRSQMQIIEDVMIENQNTQMEVGDKSRDAKNMQTTWQISFTCVVHQLHSF